MIFPKEFKGGTIMSQKCPNCGQFTNASYSRLVKDSCGHTKCRMCLLYEEHGCKTCQAGHCIQNIQDCRESCSVNEELNTSKILTEENLLPLELVINKDSKSKESYYNLISTEYKSPADLHKKDVTFNENEGLYKSVTTNTVSNNMCDSGKLYIPKIKSNDVVLNTHIHLRNEHDGNELANLQSKHNDQNKEKRDEEATEKNKNVRHRDRSHITLVSDNPERYKCNACSKIFRNKKGKCYHDACVTGIRPYQCTFCDRSFVKRSHFEYHERIHSGYKPYKCNLCEKAFPQQNKLNRHMLSHSKEKQFICSVCNKRYSKRDDLKNHLDEHNATTTYTCKFCDKPFRILTNLKRHMRTHTSERPYKCDQCSKSFKDKSMLIRHKRTHGKERPFSCAHCNRVFLSKSELRRHLVVHSDEKPFSCEYCQTQFRRKDNLNRHIRHHHSEDFSSGEAKNNKAPLAVIVQTYRNSSAKNSQQRQRQQKPRRIQLKSSGKIAANQIANLYRDQINSRLDSMGNITPVIRVTGEVSNAVPVINGPISIRRLEERSDRKMFPYTKPIPIAEAAVLNCRIEEKLYPQSAGSHNYIVRNYFKDRNSKVNSYPNNNSELMSREISNSVTAVSMQTESLLLKITRNRRDLVADICEEKSKQEEDEKRKKDDSTREKNKSADKLKEDVIVVSSKNEQRNCVSTIKKHIVQQSNGDLDENLTSSSNLEPTNHMTLPKDFQNSYKKKQSDVHWRRRTAETLKPCNH